MIDLYLFVHPFDRECYETEKKLDNFINNTTQNINLHVFPLINLTTNSIVIHDKNWIKKDWDTKTAFLTNAYAASLDFKAAQLQGKKYARRFLLALQEAVLAQGTPYTDSLAETIFIDTEGDLEAFREDRRSDLVKELFWKDQELARKFEIQQQNSAVLYNFYHEGDALLLTGTNMIQEMLSDACYYQEKTASYY